MPLLLLALLTTARAQEPAASLPRKGAPDDFPLAKPQRALAKGQLAPEFTLPDEHGNQITLSSLRGHKVLLMFYRAYW
jgi:cytochrome oxidase Cu insertion factor (SCO1/SenC/PrrC family)